MTKKSTDLSIITTSQCPSLSGKSTLNYSICQDKDNALHLQLMGNSNAGFFNAEPIKLEAALALLAQKRVPFTSIILRRLFKGSSSNTSGFVLAALRHLGLVVSADGKGYLLSPDYEAKLAALPVPSSPSPKKMPVKRKAVTSPSAN